MAAPYRILSLDGGGIRGVIPATVLMALEQQLGQPIASSFDLIAGTSTGGILALALTIPDANGRPRYSPADIVKMYVDEGPTIFHASTWEKLARLGNLNGPKYGCSGIESVLKQFFGDARLKDALTDVLVTSYEIDTLRDPFFFRSRRARQDPTYDFYMRDVARATSAAPTYFEPLKLQAHPGDANGYYALVDGGVFANNPAMCAYAEARTVDPTRDLVLVSVGTGQSRSAISYDTARTWGVVGWAPKIIDVVFDGVQDTVDYQLKQVLPDASTGVCYYRLQCPLTPDAEAMDDTSSANMDRLKSAGEAIVAAHTPAFQQLAMQLGSGPKLAAGPTPTPAGGTG